MVFSCCIDTIYICAFKDMRENDPPKFMSNDLREAFGIDAAVKETGPGYQPVHATRPPSRRGPRPRRGLQGCYRTWHRRRLASRSVGWHAPRPRI